PNGDAPEGPQHDARPRPARVDDGPALSLPGKQQALIAALALAPGMARSRSWLRSALWSDATPERAQSSLSTALAELRRALGEAADALQADRTQVRLHEPRVRILGDAADGPLLDGLDLRNADGFEDWLRARRQGAGAAAAPALLRGAGAARRAVDVAVLPLPMAAYGGAVAPIGDAVAEEVSRLLGRTGLLDVMSHLSAREAGLDWRNAFAINGANVAFAVSGRVRSDAPRLEADVELHDLQAGTLFWSRGYSGSAEGGSADASVPAQIARAVFRSIAQRSVDLSQTQPLGTLADRQVLIAAVRLMHLAATDSFARSGRLLDELLARPAPGAAALAWRAKWHVMRVQRGLSPDPAQDRAAALSLADQALQQDEECTLAATVQGFVHSHLMRDFAAAEAKYAAALEVNASDAFASLLLGVTRAFQDVPDEAIALTERARRLSPLDPEAYFFQSLGATAYLCGRRFEEALSLAERSLAANRNHPSTQRVKVIALQMLDRGDAARRAAADLLSLEPSLTIKGYLARHPAAESVSGQEFARALAAAGVPAR
ncbi:MAG: hypothetical protein AAFU61_10485, partial [Pseudomonadota bacterium]